MKNIIFIITVLASSLVWGKSSIELIGGGLTYHVFDAGGGNYYSYKVSSDGRLISNPVFGIGYTMVDAELSYTSIRIFRGMNSVAQPINGGILALGHASRHIEFGLVAGGYVQNNNDFAGTGVVPYSVGQGSNAFVPIIGVELNWKIIFSETIFIRFINVITPILTNHTASLGFDF